MRRMPMMLILVAGYLVLRNWNGDVLPLLVVAAVGVIGVVAYRAYTARAASARREEIERVDIESLTTRVESTLAETANRILEVEGRAGLVTSEEASNHFQLAVSTFVSVDERLASATSTSALWTLVSEIKDAQWRLRAAEAVLNGEEVPARADVTGTSADRSASTRVRVDASRDAVSRWADGGPRRGHRRRRSC